MTTNTDLLSHIYNLHFYEKKSEKHDDNFKIKTGTVLK